MIQVLERAVGILQILAEQEPMSLKELTEQTGLKKPTLCLILKSMVDLGCLEKVGNGIYATGNKLQELAALPRRRKTVSGLAEQAVAHLAEELRESAVAAVVYRGVRYTIASASFRQALMVDASMQARGNFYTNATGRVLLAHMTDEQRDAVVGRDGLPETDQWPEATTHKGLEAALAGIRKAGFAQVSASKGTITFISAPVIGPDERAWLSLGVSLPAVRYAGENEVRVVDGLRQAAADLSGRLCACMDWSPEQQMGTPDHMPLA